MKREKHEQMDIGTLSDIPLRGWLALTASFTFLPQAVDADLHNNTKFLRAMTVALFMLYFGLVKVLYTAVPGLQPVRRSRPLMPGPMAEMRAQAGDRCALWTML